MSVSVEELAASLVREYLSRKGLKRTLATLDGEFPRSSESISNRLSLARAAHIEKLMKKNKEQSSPLRTMIEVIVKFLLDKLHPSSTSDPPQSGEQPLSGGENDSVTGARKKGFSTEDPTPIKVQVTPKKRGLTPTDGSRRQRSHSLGGGTNSPMKETGSRHHGFRPRSIAEWESDQRKEKSCNEQSRDENYVAGDREGTERGLKGRGRSEERRRDRGGGAQEGGGGGEEEMEGRGTEEGTEGRRRKAGEVGGGRERGGEGRGRDGGSEGNGRVFLRGRERSGGTEGGGREEGEREPGEGKTRGSDASGGGRRGHRSMKHWYSTGSVGMSGQVTWNGLQESDELYCEDLEDEDFSMHAVGEPLATGLGMFQPAASKGQPITVKTAKALRELLFGSATCPSFNSEWKRQNFFFCDLPGLEYGLVQHKGGPCGVLACVQAYILKHLLFSTPSRTGPRRLDPSPEERNSALASAMTDILWKAGGGQRATVALPSSLPQHSGAFSSRSYSPDKVTERAVLHDFTEVSALKDFLLSHITTFQSEGSHGCVYFLLSSLLSKGLDCVRNDMDERQSPLIGAHGYCTQEMVNLLLTGYAVSNVFDGNLNLDSGAQHKHILKGIPEQSEIGFLSLFEHYGSCVVGSHYKEPLWPLWVVCSESHFTILFSTERQLLTNWQLEEKFDLFYYDGLAHQDEEIRLTIDNKLYLAGKGKPEETSLVPPLELCIQTKWKNARVNWNGTEPLL